MAEMYMSLADLAGMVTDEIQTLTSRLPAAGLFTIRNTEVKVSFQEPQNEKQQGLYRVAYAHEILAAQPLDKDKDPEEFVGKTIREQYTIWPKDFTESVGLLKGRYQLAGLDNTGRMGGVEGHEPGWIDGSVGSIFMIRIRHANINGQDRAFFDWLKYEDESEQETAA